MRITSLTPMKDEAPYLLEWVAYHRLIGFNDIIVFSNDCTDGTDQMLERLDEMGLLRHYANPSMFIGAGNHHQKMMRYVNTMPRLARSDWVASFDVDEYVCVNTGNGRLEDLFAAVPDANVILMNQHNFGSSGLMEYQDELITRRYVYSWDHEQPYHRQLNRRGVKTLTHQSAKPRAWENHSTTFRGADHKRLHVVNGSGQRLPDIDMRKAVKSLLHPEYGFDLVQLNHYVLKSAQDFILKGLRGNANYPESGYGMDYWRRYDHNDLRDGNIGRWVDEVDAMRADLMKDPELGGLHRAAVAAAQERIAGALETDIVRKLMRRISRYRLNNPVPEESAQTVPG